MNNLIKVFSVVRQATIYTYFSYPGFEIIIRIIFVNVFKDLEESVIEHFLCFLFTVTISDADGFYVREKQLE